jgi:surface polysaccharide O-acyltransferase-like enzyme
LNDTFGVALMTIAWILLFRKIERTDRFYDHVLLPVSKASYGMYLSHLLVLGLIAGWIRTSLGLGTEGVLGTVWTTPVQIFSIAILSFVSVALACVLVQKIPRVGKWLMG